MFAFVRRRWKKHRRAKHIVHQLDDNKEETKVEEDEAEDTYVDNDEEWQNRRYGEMLIVFTCNSSTNKLIDTLRDMCNNAEFPVFTNENACVQHIGSLTNKVFLVIDHLPTLTLIEAITPLTQIDSVFIYATSVNDIVYITQIHHAYFVHHFDGDTMLEYKIKKSYDEMDSHIAVVSVYNTEEQVIRYISQDPGSFMYFQLFKYALRQLPKTNQTKQTMVTVCQYYYRGDVENLESIDKFDRSYQSSDAIPWFTRESFLSKFINKALRTECMDALYQFRFYLLDLSEQLERQSAKLKTRTNPLKLYRCFKLSQAEIESLQKSIGKSISFNGYLSTTSERSIASNLALKLTKAEGFVRILFELVVDFQKVPTINVADIRAYSTFAQEAEHLFDMGTAFQVDSCEYSAEEDLWHAKVHATDGNADMPIEYMEYQKKKLTESNIVLQYGTLLVDMGEYCKAERYFDTILNQGAPNDEEIASLYYNMGCIHRLKGDFHRAIKSYTVAYNLHLRARPKRVASAGKCVAGLGITYSEQGKQVKAEECFQRTMNLYKKSLPKQHVDVAGILINLASIDSERHEYEEAMSKYERAKKIFDALLPPDHPNHVLIHMNVGNINFATGKYTDAINEYESALRIQEKAFPKYHPNIAHTLYNLGLTYVHLKDMEKANKYLQQAEDIAKRTLPGTNPIVNATSKTNDELLCDTEKYAYIQ